MSFRIYPLRRVSSLVLVLLLCTSCSKTIGWGVLLWYTDNPPIPAGVILPVYARSNIEQVWVAGIPDEYRLDERENCEIPLSHLELAKSKRAAQKRAAELAEYLSIYAEVMQDGLPVRDQPENNASRVYRLRLGEIVKIISKIDGQSAISTTGAPLDGQWYKILTENGASGFCFSIRLKLFEHGTGPLPNENREEQEEIDTHDESLDALLSRVWYPESWGDMLASGKLNIEELSRPWGFEAGTDSRTAKMVFDTTNLSFPYTRIKKELNGSWVFEGSSLVVSLRSGTSLFAQYEDADGQKLSASFVVFPETAAAVIRRENERREILFRKIYAHGPSFHSVHYGTITFTYDMRFSWGGANLPQGIVSESALGSGTVNMGRYLEGQPEGRYDGAFALVFDMISGKPDEVTFLYSLEPQGLRLEYAPPSSVNRLVVTRPNASPLVIYFSTGEQA